MLEFTGERVIPGLVDPNLFNEHLARYRFASRFAEHARVLDAGCGSGYGSAELRNAAAVIAMDISAEAVAHARGAFPSRGVEFLQGACESLPFAGKSFDLLVAFEVIEHLERWQDLLTEARRVLRPSGILLVSTPNKAWYAESRAGAGANPYHVHEFEYREFETALLAVFPNVHLWSQNHSAAIAFVPMFPARGELDAPADAAPEQAHFFLAACSEAPIQDTRAFAWLPTAGNVLRERQLHIALLESEVEKKDAWLAETRDSRQKIQQSHAEVLAELHERNVWADRLNAELDGARAVIAGLQQEVKTTHAGYQDQLSRLHAEALTRLEWVHDLEAQVARGRAEIERLAQENQTQEQTIIERTQWAQSLDQNLQRARTELAALESAGLVRLGRKLQMLPGKSE